MRERIAVIVVNWNGWRDTLAAHASLVRSDEQGWRLYIVDNASTDGSVENLDGLPKTTLMRNARNEGFAGASNIGITRAIEDGCDFVFLLNNDATVRPDTLTTLLRYASEQPRSVLGCTVRYSESQELQFFGSQTGRDGAPRWYEYPADREVLSTPLIPTDFVFGAALFARASHFKSTGLFDERFFLTYEETDWCYRATAAGISHYIVRDAVVDHQSSKSLGPTTSPLQAYFLQRNRLLFLEKNAGMRGLLRGLRETRWAARSAPTSATRKAMNAGTRDYLLRRFGDCPVWLRPRMAG